MNSLEGEEFEVHKSPDVGVNSLRSYRNRHEVCTRCG